MGVTPAFLIIGAAILGLVIGSFLNVVAYRVPAHISLLRESRCPQCDAKIKPWHNVPIVGWVMLRGRCASCGARISVRYPVVEALTGLAFAGVTWWALAGGWASEGAWAVAVVIAAFLYLAAISIVLTLIDLDTKRLPNSIVLPSYIVGGALLTGASWLTSDWSALLRAGIGMVALYAFYFLLRFVRPGGMGGGDVKLAGVLGMYLGWVGWAALIVGGFAAFVLGGIFGILLLMFRRAKRKSAIPFGPWMILGAWVGLVAGESVGQWYMELLTGA